VNLTAPTGEAVMPPASGFAAVAGPFRPELLAHCYRILGELAEPDDEARPTLLDGTSTLSPRPTSRTEFRS
jgi:hypothetical protein